MFSNRFGKLFVTYGQCNSFRRSPRDCVEDDLKMELTFFILVLTLDGVRQ